MSLIADPFTDPTSWDAIVVVGQRSPGLMHFEEAPFRPYGWDIKKGKGAAGATLTHTGSEIAQWKTRHELWTSAAFIAWAAWTQLLKYEPTKGLPVVALDVFHPALVAIDVSVAVVKKLSAPIHVGKGKYEAKIEWLEYRPPPPVKATATPSSSSVSDPTRPGPPLDVAVRQATVGALQVQVQQAFE